MAKQDKNLGEFEQLIILAILRKDNDSYGAEISATIEECGGRDTNFGALYTTLSRLEEKEIVTSKLGEATAIRGGRAKKYFQVTANGQSAVKRSVDTILNMASGLTILSDKSLGASQ